MASNNTLITTIYFAEKDLRLWEMARDLCKQRDISRNRLVMQLLRRELKAAGYNEDDYELLEEE